VRGLSTGRVHPAFLLDEAHLMQQQVLDHLHILADYEWDSAGAARDGHRSAARESAMSPSSTYHRCIRASARFPGRMS